MAPKGRIGPLLQETLALLDSVPVFLDRALQDLAQRLRSCAASGALR